MVIRVGPATKVPVSELAVERIPQRPVVEQTSPESEGEGLQAGEGGSTSSSDSSDQGGLHTTAFRALSGAFQSPYMWQVRTAVWDARNIIVGGGFGLVLLFFVWLFKPEPSPQLSSRSPLEEQVWEAVPGGMLVSASLKANIPRHVERRRAEIQSELQFVEDTLKKKQGAEREASLSEQQRNFRTRQVRHRTVVLQLRQEVASLLDIRRNLPASPAALVSFAESYEATSEQVKAAREAASEPVWRLRQAASALVGAREDSQLAPLQKEVSEADQKLRAVMTAEIGRLIVEGLQRLRSELGLELDAHVRGELIEKLLKGGGEFVSKREDLEQYRQELAFVDTLATISSP